MIRAAEPHLVSPTDPHCLLCCLLLQAGKQHLLWRPRSHRRGPGGWRAMEKDFEGHASLLLHRGSSRQGGHQEARVSHCKHISPCFSPTTPRAGDVPTRPARSPCAATGCWVEALCSPQTRAQSIWCLVHKYMKYFITPDTKAKF